MKQESSVFRHGECQEALTDKEMPCDKFKRYVDLAVKDITPWLEEEVEK